MLRQEFPHVRYTVGVTYKVNHKESATNQPQTTDKILHVTENVSIVINLQSTVLRDVCHLHPPLTCQDLKGIIWNSSL